MYCSELLFALFQELADFEKMSEGPKIDHRSKSLITNRTLHCDAVLGIECEF